MKALLLLFVLSAPAIAGQPCYPCHQGNVNQNQIHVHNKNVLTATGGNASATATGIGTGTATVDGSGNSTVTVNTGLTSGDGIGESALFIPPVVPETPSASIPGADVAYTQSACGPRMAVVRTPVTGTFFGLTHRVGVDLGFDDSVVPADQPYRYVLQPDGSTLKLGHRVLIQMMDERVSGSRNLALGGGGDSGWGQAGGGSSSAMSRLVNRIVLLDCEVGTLQPRIPQIPQVPQVPRG